MTERQRTILVVDDDEDVLFTARTYLEDQGYEVLQATNGAAGLELLKGDTKIDLLFTDIVMPGGMDGFELVRQAKQVRPKLRVLYTSGFFKEMPAVGREMHGELLPKPWRFSHLDEAVKRAFHYH
ncbi:MAG TPA: response regulator [Alphaproteobacteria bacterium]